MLDIIHQIVHLLQSLNLIPVLPTLSMVFSAAQSVHMCSSAANPKGHRPDSHTFDVAG